jgi:hypothetical protein
MIELENDLIRIYTVDHTLRKQTSEADWNGGNLRELVERKRNVLPATEKQSFTEVEEALPKQVYTCSVGGSAAALGKVLPLSDSRCLVVQDDGYFWETDFKAEAVLGSLHLGDPLADAVVAEDGVWRAWGHSLVRSDPHNLRRFHRDASAAKEESLISFKENITLLCARQGGGVWVCCERELFEVPPECGANLNSASGIIPLHVLTTVSRIVRLFEQNDRLRWVDEDRQLWSWDRKTIPVKQGEGVVAWDMIEEAEAGIEYNPDEMLAFYRSADGNWTFPLSTDAVGLNFEGDIVCLGQGFALLLNEGKAWFWEVRRRKITPLDSGSRKVTSISRVGKNPTDTFYLATLATVLQPPQLQMWQFTGALLPI